ncbi:hypothetical protein [Adhaeretor mobilis]|uniref:Transposase IS200-like domain-containing protein n=1 Tax=Adhaeretor mobilis TaxID=1930276 RepID=A0A517MUY9_9BACT|nr:hypothetical protein [Adhaeretor mobilis]QDS98700.1 hypothetical protein HG15A2_19820 [Adhaeretor mobilis]
MPCYLFTYHAHGSWLSDTYQASRDGVYQRALFADQGRAERGRIARSQSRRPIRSTGLLAAEQKLAIEGLTRAAQFQNCEIHYVATDRTHVHVLVSWQGACHWKDQRANMRKAIVANLQKMRGRETWLSEGSSRKRIKDKHHFQQLMTETLPKHRGLKWSTQREVHA